MQVYDKLIERADKLLEERPEALFAIALITKNGSLYAETREENLFSRWRADVDLAERLTACGDTEVTNLAVVFRGGALENPGWHLTGILRAIDEKNADAKYILRGADYVERTI